MTRPMRLRLPAVVARPVWALRFSISLLFLVASLVVPVPANAQSACGPTEHCTAPKIGAWRYWVGSGPFGRVVNKWFNSAAEAESAMYAAYWPSATWCSLTVTSHESDVYIGTSGFYPVYHAGIEYLHSTKVNYQYVGNVGSGCLWSGQMSFGYEHRRDVSCPFPYTLKGGSGAVEAYCSRPIEAVEPEKMQGTCPAGQGSSNSLLAQFLSSPTSASATARRFIGNPCELGSGNKVQVELDYRGAGAYPLTFRRTYNSYEARTYDNAHPPPWRALGKGWSATYFQRIQFVEWGGRSSVWAYRPDGRVVIFTLSGGQYVAPADIADRLTRLFDGGGTASGWKLTSEHEESETYDAAGRLLSIQNRAGLMHTLNYDTGGYLASVSDGFGHTLSFAFTATNRRNLASFADSGGANHAFAYDSDENLTSVTHPDTTTTQYLYNTNSQLTGIKDETNVQFATYTYGSSGVASSEHAGAVGKYSIAYSGSTRTVTDPLNTVRTYSFLPRLAAQRNSGFTQPAASGVGTTSASATFDANANTATRTDPVGVEARYTFELSRNLETSRTEAYGTAKARTITTQWHPVFRLPAQVDEPNRRTTFTHDANGNGLTRTVTDLSVTPNVSRTWTYTYNSVGQVLTEDGPRTGVADVTTWSYYSCTTGAECGQVRTVTNALGHVTTYNVYNAHGQPLSITDPNGIVTTLTYDLRQRLTSRTLDGETTTMEYWPTGLLKKVTLPDASFVQYTYDSAHRLTQIADAQGNRIVYTLDAMGNRIREETFDPSNALARLHHRAFNSLNQLWKEIGSANTPAVTTTFGFDNNGNQTSTAAPLGRNTASLYDELNRLKQITDAASGVTQFGHDASDSLTSVTDARGKVTSYLYNGFGEVTQLTSPDTGVSASTYDAAGNLATATDARGKVATYSHDALNRVTQLSYPDQTIAYTWDAGTNKGRLMQVSDGSGSTAWTYTNEGRTASRTQTMGSVVKSVGYGYNSAGQLTSLTTPSGQVIGYSYANNRITGITVNGATLLTSVLYDPFGPARQWDWGNGTLSVRSFDADGNVALIDSSGLKSYVHDDAFRITGVTDSANPSLSWAYGYDSLDRLTSASKTGQSQTWTYDANGNRLAQGGSASSTYTVSTTSNRLNSVSGALSRTYSFDAAGNTTSYSGLTFTYNDAGRMVGVSGGATASYVHSALGQRVKKVAGASTTYFVFDEAGHLIGEYDSSGALIQEIVWFEDTPVASLRNSGGSVSAFYVHADHLNTPRKITRPADNAILWRWDSDPFGTDAANADADGDTVAFTFNPRFPGQYHDSETGLNYNYFRDYDPQIGRYPQSDPIGLRGGINTYAYVGGNPLSRTDPFGLTDRAAPGYVIPRPILNPWPVGSKENTDLAWAIQNAFQNLVDAIRDLCTESEEERCKKVLDNCRKRCTDMFVDDPGSLPGMGSDMPGRLRRCIRECMEAENCFDF